MTRLDSGSATLVGRVRSANEDSLLVTDRLVAVADGMGGHRGGEVASADAVDVLAGVSESHSLEDLVLAVHMANRRINDRSAEDEALRGMGTTVCAVGLVDSDGEQLAILNVGDSRVYLFAEGELRQLTEDHSLVETLVREGRISAEEAETHPQRNVLTRALGVEPLIVVDAWLLSPRDGDRLLLCSDGLFNELSRERIAEIMAESDNAEVTARRLASEAESAGGRDNITTVVADVFDTGLGPAPAGDRVRRIATPTVDLDDTFDDVNRTATVPMVPISPTPQRDTDAGTDPESDAEAASAADAEGEGEADAAAETDPDGPGSESGVGDDESDDGRDGYGDQEVPGEAHDVPVGEDADTDLGGDGPVDAPEAASRAATRSGFTWRTAVFILAVLAVLAIPVGILLWNAGQGYLVKGSGDTVVLYSGSSGGFLWVQPEELKSHRIIVDDLPPRYRDDVIAGRTYTDEAEAERFIRNLEREADLATTTTTSTTTTTTTTTTTVAPTVPTTAPDAAPMTAQAPTTSTP